MPNAKRVTAEEYRAEQAKPRRRKYGNTPTVVDGIRFDSLREANRYSELKLMERAGEISDLRLQVRYQLCVNGVKVCTYVADFVYVRDGITVVSDAKGVRTRDYILEICNYQKTANHRGVHVSKSLTCCLPEDDPIHNPPDVPKEAPVEERVA